MTITSMFVRLSPVQHALSDASEKKPFEPLLTCNQVCRITTFQDCYFFTESFEEAKDRMR